MTDQLLTVLKRLPAPVLQAVVRGEQTFGEICEVRIRQNCPIVLTTVEGGLNRATSAVVDAKMMAEIVAALCDHSFHAHADTIREGYIALPNGVRVGVAGRAICRDGEITTVTEITSLCIRVPGFRPEVGRQIFRRLRRTGFSESWLFFSPPGVGKTTLLRSLAALLSGEAGLRVALIDTRCELADEHSAMYGPIDRYSGYPKGKAIELATRTMNPQYLICDEIGTLEEAMALLAVENAGVPLLATAHARDIGQLMRRQTVRILHRANVFDRYVQLIRVGSELHFHLYDRDGRAEE